MVIICDDQGWTYQEYLEQPTWFIQLLIRKKEIDQKHSK